MRKQANPSINKQKQAKTSINKQKQAKTSKTKYQKPMFVGYPSKTKYNQVEALI